jgi:hypothetical protein
MLFSCAVLFYSTSTVQYGKLYVSLGFEEGLFDGKALALEFPKYKNCTYDGLLKEMSANQN